jgi:hypothetical protein
MQWKKQCDDQREAREFGNYVGLNGERCEMYIYSRNKRMEEVPSRIAAPA